MLPKRMVQQLETALHNLRYGTVQLIVHDAQVVRIERVERIRLPSPVDSDPEEAHQTHG